MPGRRPQVKQLLVMGAAFLFAIGQVVWRSWGSPADMLPGIAFFLGGGGMVMSFMLGQWRKDKVALVLAAVPFGTWALAVAAASVDDDGFESGHVGYWIAGVALTLGFAGGVTNLVRLFLEYRREKRTAGPEHDLDGR